MENKIPSIMISPARALSVSKPLKRYAAVLKGLAPNIQNDMIEAGMSLNYLDYFAAGLLMVIILGSLLVVVAGLIALVAFKKDVLTAQLGAILTAMVFIVPIVYVLYFVNYPKLQAQKRKKKIDEKTIFAIREIMIKVGSGEPIFNSLLDVANGDFDIVSEEFKVTVEEIQTGVSQEQALENLSRRVPSQSLKRAIDIIVNTIKSGSDIHETLALINDMLIRKQQSDMRAYAGELTPMSMAYMLVSVVLPSLGMSVFVILGSLAHLDIQDMIYLIPPFLAIFQIFFMGMVGSRRPAIGI